MAEMCDNILAISGPDDDVMEFKEMAVGFSPWREPRPGEAPAVLNFHSLLPIPSRVLAAGYGPAGQDWEFEHWGCKWGACQPSLVDDQEGNLIYAFESAWFPPLEFVFKVSRQWPTLEFELDYREERADSRQVVAIQDGDFSDY